MDIVKFARQFRVKPGEKVNLAKEYDPRSTAGYEKKSIDADERLQDGVKLLAEYQERLYAENARSLLVVFQAMDAAGLNSSAFPTPTVNVSGGAISITVRAERTDSFQFDPSGLGMGALGITLKRALPPIPAKSRSRALKIISTGFQPFCNPCWPVGNSILF